MKKISYVMRCQSVSGGAITVPVEMPWNESNEDIAKKEAYNGEYIIEDDGQPEPVAEPTADVVLNALLGVAE